MKKWMLILLAVWLCGVSAVWAQSLECDGCHWRRRRVFRQRLKPLTMELRSFWWKDGLLAVRREYPAAPSRSGDYCPEQSRCS